MPGSLSWIASLRCRLWRKVVVSRPCRRRRTDFRVTYPGAQDGRDYGYSECVGIRARGRSALARLDERWLMDPKRLWEPQATPLQAPIRLATVFQQNQELEKCTRADTSHLSPLTSLPLPFPFPPPLSPHVLRDRVPPGRGRHKTNLVFLMISGAPKTISVTMSTAPVTICCSSGVTPARPRPF
jgi:hypothetical protein